MARGTNAKAVNARLRQTVRDANEARQRLEARLHRAERDRDAALERLDKIERSEHPAVEAERQRAEHHAQRVADAVFEERERWLTMCEEIRPSIEALLRLAIDADESVLPKRSIDVFCEMFGDAVPVVLGLDRHARRGASTGARVRTSQRQINADGGAAWLHPARRLVPDSVASLRRDLDSRRSESSLSDEVTP